MVIPEAISRLEVRQGSLLDFQKTYQKLQRMYQLRPRRFQFCQQHVGACAQIVVFSTPPMEVGNFKNMIRIGYAACVYYFGLIYFVFVLGLLCLFLCEIVVPFFGTKVEQTIYFTRTVLQIPARHSRCDKTATPASSARIGDRSRVLIVLEAGPLTPDKTLHVLSDFQQLVYICLKQRGAQIIHTKRPRGQGQVKC